MTLVFVETLYNRRDLKMSAEHTIALTFSCSVRQNPSFTTAFTKLSRRIQLIKSHMNAFKIYIYILTPTANSIYEKSVVVNVYIRLLFLSNVYVTPRRRTDFNLTNGIRR